MFPILSTKNETEGRINQKFRQTLDVKMADSTSISFGVDYYGFYKH